MRCFFAIPADIPELRTALAAWRLAEPALRWEVPEALHLTLRFIGDWPNEHVPELVAALADLRWQPFTLQLTALGAFPDFRRPHTLWAGIAPSAALRALVTSIAARLEPLGIAREPRPYTPHISVAHLRRGQQAARRPTVPSATLAVSVFHLYESVPGARAAQRYPIRHRFAADAPTHP